MINPLLLLFLPLALVPVLLHLITRHRLRTVELSTFRFLMDSYVQQRRRVQLLEFLVMLLRFGFIVLIVLTLSRPVVQKVAFLGGGGAGRDVAIVIDASPTMALASGGTTSLERARAAAETVVKLLGSEDHVKVVRAGQTPTSLAEGFAGRSDRIVELLQDLSTDAGGADLPAALEEVFASKPHGSRVVYILSDALRRTWSALADHPVLEKFDAETQVVVMDLGPAEPVANVAIVGDPPQVDRAVKGLPVLLNATVVNSSDRRPADIVLSVLMDDELVSQVNLSLQPGQRVTRSLSITPGRAGMIRGRFEVPADAFPADDAFLFCLNVAEKLSVLVVTGPSGATPAERPGLYLKAALTSPRQAKSGVAAEEQRLSEAIEVTTVRHDGLTAAMLAAADAVVLADVPLDAARGSLIRAYAEAGGGVLVLPGPHVDPAAYAAHLLGGGK
ncbi:MAG: VWA domain-containing protein, partial [Planctomycetes bacterium]|nr:VWA domain-containing protein [Planctomycetota bacterium]